MANRAVIHTSRAPEAIGTYSQAVKVDNTLYLSGQIPLFPETMELIEGGIAEQVHQVFRNLSAVCEEAGGSLAGIVKLTIYLTDLGNFPTVNQVMAEYFKEPYPARATIGIHQLPKGALVEIDAIMVI